MHPLWLCIAGHFIPRPVPAYCLVAKTAEQYGFTPFVISVGTSYFQRLAAVDPALKKVMPHSTATALLVVHIEDPEMASLAVAAAQL